MSSASRPVTSGGAEWNALTPQQFGIELDDVTTEKQIKRKEHQFRKTEEEEEEAEEEASLTPSPATLVAHTGCQIIYKIDIPANRYDMLCLEVLYCAA